LEDRVATNKLAKAKIHLLFLVKKSYKVAESHISILENFEAPTTFVLSKPKKYNEMVYMIET
jgi:hypothetical protein